MWGNRLGWTISGVLVLLMAAAVMAAGVIDRASRPTSFLASSGIDQPLSLTIAPATVVPQNDPSDAGPIYREALSIYARNPSVYERFLTQTELKPNDLQMLAAVDKLREATSMGKMTLFANTPAEVIGYDSQLTPLVGLRSVGLAAARRSLLRADREPEQALKDCEAAFSLGAKLFAERITFAQMVLGLELMGETGLQIAKLSDKIGDPQRALLVRSFESARQSFYREKVEPVWRVVSSIDPGVVGKHPGDVFAIADRAADRMWRVEAILKLGRMRFFVGDNGRAADQRAAASRVAVYAQDPDPVIAAAGAAATGLTADQYLNMR